MSLCPSHLLLINLDGVSFFLYFLFFSFPGRGSFCTCVPVSYFFSSWCLYSSSQPPLEGLCMFFPSLSRSTYDQVFFWRDHQVLLSDCSAFSAHGKHIHVTPYHRSCHPGRSSYCCKPSVFNAGCAVVPPPVLPLPLGATVELYVSSDLVEESLVGGRAGVSQGGCRFSLHLLESREGNDDGGAIEILLHL
jgi:hypothetical protein